MKGNDRYYLNDPNYYKSLNFAGINNHLKGLSNSRKIVLSDIYHHCIKKKKKQKQKKKTAPSQLFNQLRGTGYQRKQSFLRLICLFPLRLRKKIQEPEKRPRLANDRNGVLKACYDNKLDKFFVTAIRKIPFQATRPQNIQPIFEHSTILN